MPPSASKQKRLAEKAAKAAAREKAGGSSTTGDSTTNGDASSTPGGSSVGTPLTSLSAAGSQEDLSGAITSMKKLNMATERSAAGVLVSDVKGRDIKIDQYTLSFHGRLLIEGAEVALNYGQRYGWLGENGSGKVRCSYFAVYLACIFFNQFTD